MTNLDFRKMAVRPIYAVLFATAGDIDAPYSPVAAGPLGEDTDLTVPHGFDRELAQALPGLWYCLHLPKTLLDLVDVSTRALKKAQRLHLDHRILVLPITAFDVEHLGAWPPQLTMPALTFCPDDLLEEATPRAASLGFPFPPVPYSELSDASLKAHWRLVQARFAPNIKYLGNEPQLALRLDIQPIDLPRRWLARQLKTDQGPLSEGSAERLLDQAMWQQLVLASIARLEDEGASRKVAEDRMPEVLQEESRRLRVPMSLGLPGVPSIYSRRAYKESLHERIQALPALDEADTWSITMHERPDSLIERSVIEFLATHRSLATGGVGLMLPSVPQEAFTVLAALERHFTGTPRGPQVRRLLARLQKATQSIWTDTPASVVAQANHVDRLLQFPAGSSTAARRHGSVVLSRAHLIPTTAAPDPLGAVRAL